jgi:hypothetical protein
VIPAWVILVACLLVEAVMLPIGMDDLDEGYFAYQAERVLSGHVPFRDFESLYTPGLTYVHALLFTAIGQPHLIAPRALSLVLRGALAALLYALARPLVRHPIWAAVPGALVLIGFDPAPDRWEPHPGWPSTVFALLSAWCLTRPTTPRWLLASGAAAAAAYAFKQNAGALMLLAIVLHTRRRAALPLGAFVAASALWLGPLVVAVGGRLDVLGPLVGLVNQTALFSPPELTILIPIACLLAGLRQLGDARARWLLLAGVCLFATQYPRSDTVHLAWSAPLLLVVGVVVLSRMARLPALLATIAAFVLCAPNLVSRGEAVREATTTIVGVAAANGLRVPAATWSDVLNTVAEIRYRTGPAEPIFVYPTSPLLYVLAQRDNPTRFDHLNPGAANARDIEQLITTLQRERVRLVVVGEFWRLGWGPPRDNAPLEAWIAAEFEEVTRFGQYRILVRSSAGL